MMDFLANVPVWAWILAYFFVGVTHFVILAHLDTPDDLCGLSICVWPLVWIITLAAFLVYGTSYCWNHSHLLGLLRRRKRPNKNPRLPGTKR